MRIGRDDIKVVSGREGFNEWNRSKVLIWHGIQTNGKVCPGCRTTKEWLIEQGDEIEAEDLHEGEVAVRFRCRECGTTWVSAFAVDEDGNRHWQKHCMVEKGGPQAGDETPATSDAGGGSPVDGEPADKGGDE